MAENRAGGASGAGVPATNAGSSDHSGNICSEARLVENASFAPGGSTGAGGGCRRILHPANLLSLAAFHPSRIIARRPAFQKENMLMEFNVNDTGTWKKEVKVKVLKDEIAAKHREILNDIRRNVPVPGFRIGHTPDDILSIRFRDDINDRLKSTVLSENAGEAVEKANIHAVSVPDMKHEEISVSPEQDLEFSFTVEVRPEFELPEYRGLKVEAPPAAVTDADMEMAIEGIRRRVAEYKPVEEAAAHGDALVADVTITAAGAAIREDKESIVGLPAENAGSDVLLGLSGFPVAASAFLGVKAGEERTAEFALPDDYSDEALRGQKAAITLKVHEVRRMKLPDIDEDFAKRAGLDNLDALKDEVRKNIAREKRTERERALRATLVDKLVEAAKFDLPEELLNSEKERHRTRTLIQLSRLGLSPDAIKKDEENIREAAGRAAERNLRKSFIISAIAEKEKIEADEGEVEERIEALARYWNTTPVSARNRLAESDGMSLIYQDVLEDKVLALVREAAEITDAAPGADAAAAETAEKKEG